VCNCAVPALVKRGAAPHNRVTDAGVFVRCGRWWPGAAFTVHPACHENWERAFFCKPLFSWLLRGRVDDRTRARSVGVAGAGRVRLVIKGRLCVQGRCKMGECRPGRWWADPAGVGAPVYSTQNERRFRRTMIADRPDGAISPTALPQIDRKFAGEGEPV
jgi:hypothetical protein